MNHRPLRPLRICVYLVDDYDMFLQAFRRQYGTRWEVKTEPNGKAALKELLGPAEFDVIILDLFLPDMTGAEIYEHCKRDAPARCKRVVFLSAGIDHPDLVPWLEATGQPMLQKPIDPGVIEQTVERFARLTCSRGPREEDDMPRERSRPELPPLVDDDDEEISTDMIRIEERSGRDPKRLSKMTEVYHRQKNKQMAKDMREIKELISSVNEFLTKLAKTAKTLIKVIPIFVAGAAALFKGVEWIADHFVFKK